MKPTKGHPGKPNGPAEFWSHVDQRDDPDDCWEWKLCRNDRGYGIAYQNMERWIASRLAWTLTHGPIPPGLFVCHSCDNPPCCNPRHLWLGTVGENTRDSLIKGRQDRRGERAPRHKVTTLMVQEIRRRYAAGGVLQRELGAEFGITAQQIGRIVSRQSWGGTV